VTRNDNNDDDDNNNKNNNEVALHSFQKNLPEAVV
jgi:hypothetical protein